jgi:nitric oxide reductase NorD protein
VNAKSLLKMAEERKEIGLEELAAAIEARSPGFAGRIREVDGRLAVGPGRAGFAAALDRVVALEGPGREVGLALVALEAERIESLSAEGLRCWCSGLEEIGEHSVRAAQAFGLESLAALDSGVGADERLASGSRAVAALAERRRNDPLVPRFAAAAGAVVANRGGLVVEAWGRYCEAAIFGARRAAGDFAILPEAARLDDEELAGAIDLAARVARTDRLGGRKVFEAIAPSLEGVPRSQRGSLLALGRSLAGDATLVLGYGEDLEGFVAEGLAMAEVEPVAAEAFFSLETRGARAFLTRHEAAVVFEDVETTLRGYLELVQGERLPLIGADVRGLFAPVSRDGKSVAVARRAGVFPIWEENFTLMKLQLTLGLLWRAEATHEFDVGRFFGTDEGGGLDQFFRHFESPEAAAGLFLHLEAVRSMPLIARLYPGLASDLSALRRRVFPRDEVAPDAGSSSIILFLAIGGDVERVGSAGERVAVALDLARAALAGTATVYDSARCTVALANLRADGSLAPSHGLDDLIAEDPMLAYLLELEDDDTPAPPGEMGESPPLEVEPHDGQGRRSDETSPGVPMDPDVLAAYLEQNPDLTVQRSEDALDPTGLFVAGLTGSGSAEDGTDPTGATPDRVWAAARPTRTARGIHLQDEWDHRIADYRVGWCEVHDVDVEGDSGSFFSSALRQHRELLPEVRRQFQRVKPEGYRILRGLLDGEDFDLNAVVDARADLRARRDTTSKLYTARRREERDVATLFLLDMSASTDEETEAPEPVADPGEDVDLDLVSLQPRPRRRRIIDIQKEALVIMAQALEEIGDHYAIYGFSGHGRKQVELYAVKSFEEPLTMAVRGRIGGIEPQRSTRMGAALRQAMTHFQSIAARAKHLILLSDGFPQDFDYGDDRRSNVYGLKDTAMALREAERSGISTFCITVDRAGNDYLREMCEERRYLVIDEIDALPLELPKIYSEATRAE